MVLVGTNAVLIVSGFSVEWWPLASVYWAVCYNAWIIGRDGLSAWYRVFGEGPKFRAYPFGALVFVKTSPELLKSKNPFMPKMTPHLLVGVGLAPGCRWDRSYLVVRLSAMLGKGRGNRCHVRKTREISFPEVPSFPLKLRLNTEGAICDENLLAPAVGDSTNEAWTLDEGSSDEEDAFREANQPNFKSRLEEALALDPEMHAEELQDEEQIVVERRAPCWRLVW